MQELCVDVDLAARCVDVEEFLVGEPLRNRRFSRYAWYYEGESDGEEGEEAPSAWMWSLCIHFDDGRWKSPSWRR